MQKIVDKGILVGIKIDKIKKGSVPITEPNEFVQVVTLSHKKGAYLKPHLHAPKRRVTTRLQECILVRKGRVTLKIYNDQKELIKHMLLRTGQGYLSLRGGVGMEILEDAEVIEVKNGPFKEDKVLI
jgi:hypothetical protein